MYLRKDLETARRLTEQLIENNNNLTQEVDAMNDHIRVVSHQNDELTKEIDTFVQANEVIRQNLDRKGRVQQLRSSNDEKIARSYADVQSRSP